MCLRARLPRWRVAAIGSVCVAASGWTCHAGETTEGQSVAAEAQQLEAVLVTGSTDTKTEQSAFEMPFTVNGIPREIIDDELATRLTDALKNVSGIAPNSDNGGTNDNFTLRGFDLDGFGYRNGVRIDIPQFDPAGIERVDVLKGAAANLYGRIEPGGMVNVVTKRPLAERYHSLEQRAGEFDYYRTEGDFTGPVTTDGEWLYRLVFSYQNNGSFRDFVGNERLYLFPSLTWQPSVSTQFNLGFEYKDNVDSIDYGIPTRGEKPLDVPRERFLGLRGAESDRSFYLIDFNWSHVFNERWEFRQKFLWYLNSSDYRDSGPSNFCSDRGQLLPGPLGSCPDANLLDVFVSTPFHEDYDEYFTEIDLTGRIAALGMQHELLFGAEYNRSTQDASLFNAVSLIESPTLRPINFRSPSYQLIADLAPIDVPGNYRAPGFFENRIREHWYALFAQDIVDVTDRFHVVLTGRYDIRASHKAGSCLVLGGATCSASLQEVEDSVFSPRVGANYELLPWLAVYGNYARSFGSPGFGVLADGSPPEFERGEQREVGLKGKWFDERLHATLAFYHLRQSDRTVPVINPNPSVVTQVGEARSQGIELDVQGRLFRRWFLMASYAFTDARVTEDQAIGIESDPFGNQVPVLTPGLTGRRLANVPEHAVSIWSRHALSDAFSVAGGVFAMTSREVDAENTVEVAGYVRVDVAAAYRFRLGSSWLRAQLNVFNLLDNEYFDPQTSFARTINVSPGAPRTVLGSLTIEF